LRIRYRPIQAVAIATLAALITACAAFAPLYDRAMRQALTDIAVAQERVSVVGLHAHAVPEVESSYLGSAYSTAPPVPPQTVFRALPSSLVASYRKPIFSHTAVVIPQPAKVEDPTGELRWRDGACDHVSFVEGACPAGPGDLAISESDARSRSPATT
jgi:putative ABC transport system permease protein